MREVFEAVRSGVIRGSVRHIVRGAVRSGASQQREAASWKLLAAALLSRRRARRQLPVRRPPAAGPIVSGVAAGALLRQGLLECEWQLVFE